VTPAATVTPAPPASPAPDPFELARRLQMPGPHELADKLADVETKLASLTGGDVAELAAAQQAAHRQLVDHPEWRAAVLARLPADARAAAETNAAAIAELRALTPPREVLPSWRIVRPPPVADLLAWYREGEASTGVPWRYLAAVHLVETVLGRIVGPSSAGAQGPMQFMPSTWAAWGKGDVHDNHDAILAAARYLKGHGAPADMERALFAYNRSRRYVRAITLYAGRMTERTFRVYWHWQVYVRTTHGDALLPEGYGG
jgi:hypothetical protein